MLTAIHAPKHETFDLVARTNTDPKGIVRAVDVYTVEPWGLYMARPTPGRAQFHYMESWLLPSLGCGDGVPFQPRPRTRSGLLPRRRPLPPAPTAWHAEDHYLDLVVRTGIGVELSDVDELLTAVRHGLLTPGTGERARAERRSPPSTGCPGTTTTCTLARRQRYDADLAQRVVPWAAGMPSA